MGIFRCAIWKPISVNVGGYISSQHGAVMHQTAAPGNSSPFGWFNNPAAEVSAHFWAAADGRIEQYVDTARVAWHAVALNGTWIGIEFGGLPTDKLTPAQIEAGGRILEEGHRLHGWKLQLANDISQYGFGYHRMAGSQTNTGCPSDLRLAYRDDILKAAGGTAPAPGPSPKPPPSGGVPPLHVDYFGQHHNPTVADVRTWQEKMHGRGWNIGVDQIYGPQSESVCRSFQAEKGLSVDGLVGPQTWNATWTAPVT
jgi:peptidoglycan hydrolase-like protein with peptidoglycan-binding domain